MKNPFRSARMPSMEDAGEWFKVRPTQVRCSGFVDVPHSEVVYWARRAIHQHLAADAEVSISATLIRPDESGKLPMRDPGGWVVLFKTSRACVLDLAAFLREADPNAAITDADVTCVFADEEERIMAQTVLARRAVQSSDEEVAEVFAGPSVRPTPMA